MQGVSRSGNVQPCWPVSGKMPVSSGKARGECFNKMEFGRDTSPNNSHFHRHNEGRPHPYRQPPPPHQGKAFKMRARGATRGGVWGGGGCLE